MAYWMADEPLGALDADGLEADADRLREADLLVPLREGLLQEALELLDVGRALFELDAGVDVLRVLAEDHHVDLFGPLHGRGHAGEPADRAKAGVEVEPLAERHVQRADAAADRRGQRALDADEVLLERLDGRVGQPALELVVGLLAGVDLVPVDLLLTAVGLLDRGVEDTHGGLPDIRPDAVAFDERDDGVVGDVEGSVAPHLEGGAGLGRVEAHVDVPPKDLGKPTLRASQTAACERRWGWAYITAAAAASGPSP